MNSPSSWCFPSGWLPLAEPCGPGCSTFSSVTRARASGFLSPSLAGQDPGVPSPSLVFDTGQWQHDRRASLGLHRWSPRASTLESGFRISGSPTPAPQPCTRVACLSLLTGCIPVQSWAEEGLILAWPLAECPGVGPGLLSHVGLGFCH